MKRIKISEEEQAHMLRGVVEARLSLPAVISVTCAEPADGAGTVAMHLAHAFGASGTPTLVIDASGVAEDREDDLTSLPSLDTLPTAEADNSSRVGNVRAACLSKQAAERLRIGEIESALHDMRERYPVTIVILSPATTSGSALLFARVSEAVLLTVRMGRPGSRADQHLIERLDGVEANVIGVVPIAVDVKRLRSRRRLTVADSVPQLTAAVADRTPPRKLAGSGSGH